jgi:signal transduction histidine kinase
MSFLDLPDVTAFASARRVPLIDAVLACALVVWGEVEIAAGTVHGSVAVNALAAFVSCAALAWRRSVPTAVALVCAGGLAFKTALGMRLDGLALLTAILVASYSLGRHERFQRAAPMTAAVVVLAWLSLFGLPPADQTVANYPFIALWVCGPAAAGAALRAQVAAVARQADRAVRAELEREEHARRAVAEERLRIAREMHDTVAHAVSMMVLHAGAVRSRLPDALASEKRALDDVEDAGRQAVAELQRMLRVLRSADAEAETAPQPTLGAVEELVEQTRRSGVQVRLDIDGDRRPLPPAFELTAYRILQEALTNVRKHARARSVSVALSYDADALRLRVVDDGVGCRADARASAAETGHGLAGIRERAGIYGGTVTARSPSGGGFVLEAALPVSTR